ELNTTFHKLPSEEQFRVWARQTPPDFCFAVKMNQRITHFGRLELIPTFCEQARVLGNQLGPILVQLPPTRTRDEGLLAFLPGSPDPAPRYASDSRHDPWAGVAPGPHARVGSLEGEAPFRSLRLREPPYDEAVLAGWARRLEPLLAEGI